MECFPTCRTCLQRIAYSPPAHPTILTISKYWAAAFAGLPVLGLKASEFLRMSSKCIHRFRTAPQYQAVLQQFYLSHVGCQLELPIGAN
jgi:hypothetical protein